MTWAGSMQNDQHAKPAIVFLSTHADARWLAALQSAMPAEHIVSDQQFSDEAAAATQIAIVADPSPAQLQRYPNLLWIHSVWAGVERLLPIAAARNIPLVRLIDPTLARAMGEAVLAWTLYLHRDMPRYAAQQREQRWRPHSYIPPQELTVGILGLGELGCEAARRLLDAGYRVTGWSQSPKQIDGVETCTGEAGLRTVLSNANIVVVLLPLTRETRQLLNAERFRLMKTGASIINLARGAVIATDALVDALNDDRLSHAVLDVFDEEPLAATSPLWKHSKITVLPHISAPTNRHTASNIVAANIAAFRASGAVPMAVDVTRGY